MPFFKVISCNSARLRAPGTATYRKMIIKTVVYRSLHILTGFFANLNHQQKDINEADLMLIIADVLFQTRILSSCAQSIGAFPGPLFA
jgi:hypothetical protein